ncbi:MAG TPA: type II secretion system protein [Acidimicrobiales bacterium]|nr:type II secretion system protein [Acidimicrobiales bacterium]
MFSSVIRHVQARRDSAGDAGADAGFTLIELMVVLLILAILLAIAIPTFLGVTKSADDRAAQSNLNTALVNAKAAFQQQGQSYSAVNAATLQTAEPSLTFTTATIGATTVGQNSIISMFTSTDGNGIVLTAFSKSGNCWILADNTQAISAGASISATTYTNATAPGTVPVTAGTQYGKVAGTTAALCGSGLALTGANYQTNGFPS